MTDRDDSDPQGGADDQRAYYRVQARLPVRHRELEPGEFDALKREIEAPRPPRPEVDPALASWLARVEKKLDRLIALADENAPRPLSEGELSNVEISGSGLRVAGKEEVDVGENLLVELQLPGNAERRVRAIARVIRQIEPREPGAERELALAFRVIHEDDREAIVRFSNDVQRVLLRARAAGEEG